MSCREVIFFFPFAVHVCEKKKKPNGGVCVCVCSGEEAGGGAGEPIVDMLMLLTVSTAIKMS